MRTNKKKLAALAMSVVMAASTMSFSAFAEEAQATQTEQESVAYQVDPSSIVFHYPEMTVTYTEVAQDMSGKSYEAQGAATEWKHTDADCENDGQIWLTAKIDGQVFNSEQAFKTADKLGHKWVKKDGEGIVAEFPNCTIPGTGYFYQVCERCGVQSPDLIPWKLEAEGHSYGENKVRYENLVNLKLVNGELQLVDITKDGTYDEVTYHVCERYDRRADKVCGYEEVVKTENKTIYAEKVTIFEVTAQEGIATNLIGMKEAEVPAHDKIELKDCTKDGKYQITKYAMDADGTNKVPVSQRWVTVAAHHMVTPVAIEYDTRDDASQCSYDAATGKVTNKSCWKEITYYEVIHCTAAGCPNKKCATDAKAEHYTCDNTTLTEVSRVQKVAKPEGAHIINTETKKVVQAEAAKTYADYDALKALAKNAGSYIKLSDNTATCTEDGTATVTFLCKVCKAEVEKITVKTEKLGHKAAEAVEEYTVKPTCQTMGTYDAVIYCERCHIELSRRKNVKTPRIKHSNEVSVEVNGIGVDDTNTDTNAYIKFLGDKIVDPNDGSFIREDRNTTFTNYIGYNKDKREFGVLAEVVTNCEYCKDHEVVLAKDVDITITSIEKQKESGEAGSITLLATYTKNDGVTKITKEYTVPYFTTMSSYEGRVEKAPINGLNKDADGVFRYYVNGEFQKNFAGIVEYSGSEFFVANGELCSKANGLNEYNGKWYFLSSGRIQRGYNGLALYDGAWFYLTNGELNKTVNGLVPYNGGTFLFADGRLCNEVNGLWMDFDGTWYFLALGQVQNQHTGVAIYNGAAFYVKAGKLASDYNGTMQYDGATFNVVKGQLYGPVA